MSLSTQLRAEVVSDRVVVYFNDGEHVILTAEQLRRLPSDPQSEEEVRNFQERAAEDRM